MTTEILMGEYETHEHTRVQGVPPEQIIAWLEYNTLIGFEHFYIFDNYPEQHGPLEKLCRRVHAV